MDLRPQNCLAIEDIAGRVAATQTGINCHQINRYTRDQDFFLGGRRWLWITWENHDQPFTIAAGNTLENELSGMALLHPVAQS